MTPQVSGHQTEQNSEVLELPEVLEVLEVLEMTQEEQLSSDILVKESELPVHDLPAKTTRKKNFMNF